MQSHTTSTVTNEYSFILAPSNIAGVGVFATHAIKKGTLLSLFINNSRFISKNDFESKSADEKNFLTWHCVEDVDGYWCPLDFRAMDLGWYLNHSKKPNAYDIDDTYYAGRDIHAGEEILIDYDLLNKIPQCLKPITLSGKEHSSVVTSSK
jgi:SET domain-containing protein